MLSIKTMLRQQVGLAPGQSWQRPHILLLLMAAAVPLSFSTWQGLLNNFTIEKAAFTGAEIGILQSLREIPGFLAFTAIFVLLIIREQNLALISLLVLGIGTALTGFFPTALGLYFVTVLMSIGFHYFETMQQSLTLQWVEKDKAPEILGRIIAIGSFASLSAYILILGGRQFFGFDYWVAYVLGGGLTIGIAIAAWALFPRFEQPVVQNKGIILRQRYWLYYALTFMGGARRQIFVVFAGFLMVEKFGFPVESIVALYLVNNVVNMGFAPKTGRLIHHWGERRALTLEYIGLILIFVAYAFVSNPLVAAGLYILDHFFFALAIAMKTYFQKIADPADLAPTAGVAFTINHIAAVFVPALFGLIWLVSPSIVFLLGAAMSGISLILARLVPEMPKPGHELIWQEMASRPRRAV